MLFEQMQQALLWGTQRLRSGERITLPNGVMLEVQAGVSAIPIPAQEIASLPIELEQEAFQLVEV
jgi:hypothetical protein